MDKFNVLTVKASYGATIKRFDISPSSTYADLICMVSSFCIICTESQKPISIRLNLYSLSER